MSILVVLTSLALAAAVYLFARRRPGYSHIRQTLSELGERGCADGRVVSFAVFLPVGLVLAFIWSVLREVSPAPAALAGVIAVGYCGAALFPCDPGSPTHGSLGQTLHNLAGGIQYVGGTLTLWRLGTQDGFVYVVLACIVAGAVAFLTLPSLFAWRGAAQRVGEAALFVGLAASL